MRFLAAVLAVVAALAAFTPEPQWTGVKFWAWGLNSSGQFGNATTADSPVPTLVGRLPGRPHGSARIRQVATGGTFSAGINDRGVVFLWGELPGVVSSTTPREVTGLPFVSSVSVGDRHVLALDSDGTVWAWGDNTYRQLGDGTTVSRPIPIQVPGLTGVRGVSAGYRHSLAVKTDGTVWAWGHNGFAELGDGTTVNRPTPVRLTGVSDVLTAHASRSGVHSAALKSDGTVWTWGSNASGQLGIGAAPRSYVPVRVPGVVNAQMVLPGERSTFAIAEGRLYAWGDNTSGRLGDGTTLPRRTPVVTPIANLTWADPGTGGTSAGVTADGTVLTWGDNTHGALGTGSAAPYETTAHPVAGLTSRVSTISVGRSTALALVGNQPDPTPTSPPTVVPVPDVTGLFEDTAITRITGAGLTVGSVTYWVDRLCNEVDQVTAQDPAPGVLVPPGHEVNLTVATAPDGPCP
ncbi:PASTA domain-containing protein [Herbidospora galbida]|uniref:PASTA domain-containing protein n=1 Tax=Herbidospora galbida TaxID=2575442 RepID=A0A4U3LU54_9ACTN|nr:PASTA domain-containing protein [Herbidospora galbida]TKK79019.1 PASTA domain-containing protein [Herbidospora galbida]